MNLLLVEIAHKLVHFFVSRDNWIEKWNLIIATKKMYEEPVENPWFLYPATWGDGGVYPSSHIPICLEEVKAPIKSTKN